MSTHSELSDTVINAFIDDELDAAEHRRVLMAIQANEALSTYVCELRHLRELVQHAYRVLPRPVHRSRRQAPVRPSRRYPRSIAAGLLAALCGAAGWLAHDVLDRQTPAVANASDVSFQAVRIDRPAQAGHNVLMHVNSGDPARLAKALDAAERIAREHSGPDDHLIILANDSGLNLLRADVSPYPGRIRNLLSTYPNITLVACRVGLDKLRNSQGTEVKLLPGANVGRPALEEIVTRLRDGWLYVKV